MVAPAPIDPWQRRRRRAAAAVVGAGVLGLALWVGHADPRPQPAAVQAKAGDVVDAPRLAGPDVAVAEGPAEALSAVAAEAGEEIEACGGGWVRVDGDEKRVAADIDALILAKRDQVSRVTLAEMRASADERVRAAALYYQSRLAFFSAQSDVGDCKGAECARKLEAQLLLPEAHRDELARLAQSSTDPIVYGWAVGACRSARGSSTCQLLSAAQWARLDPENAVAWLALADEARARRDAQAVDDAMFHVASARSYDHAEAKLSAVILDHAPADEASLLGVAEMAARGYYFLAADTALISPPPVPYCRAKDLDDSNRRETCERIANLAAERSTSYWGQYAGRVIGKALGWPSERLKRLEDERRAYAALRVDRSGEPKEMLSCGRARAEVELIRNVAEHGEVETARKAIVAMGRPVHERAEDAQRGPAVPSASPSMEAAASSVAAEATQASAVAR